MKRRMKKKIEREKCKREFEWNESTKYFWKERKKERKKDLIKERK